MEVGWITERKMMESAVNPPKILVYKHDVDMGAWASTPHKVKSSKIRVQPNNACYTGS